MAGIDLQPHLRDDVVTLRPLAADDWDALFAVAADPLIWAAHPAHDRWQEPQFRAFFDQALASGGALLASDTAGGRVIGTSRYDRSRAGPGEVEIGWTMLARDRWGGAANAAMKRLMIGHALDAFERTIFLVGEDNVRSRRAMEKIGGRLTGRIHLSEMAGRPVRHVVYEIDRRTFATGPLSIRAGRHDGSSGARA